MSEEAQYPPAGYARHHPAFTAGLNKQLEVGVQARVLDLPALPAAFWRSTDTLDALAGRDIGSLFRLVRKATGASQTQIGIATGLSQAQVSEIMNGARQVTSIDVFTRIVIGLRIPDPARSVLLLGDRSLAHSPAETAHTPAAIPGRSGPQTRAAGPHADVIAVYPTRSEFISRMPPHVLFDDAGRIRAAGLSLNLLCQQYADDSLLRLVARGTRLQCLFLDPDGEAIAAREREEGHPAGHLASLTRLNLQHMLRNVRDRLPADRKENLEVATYDETIRFNIILVNDDLCVAQPYLPSSRGVNSPTLVMDRQAAADGLYRVFEEIFNSLSEQSRSI